MNIFSKLFLPKHRKKPVLDQKQLSAILDDIENHKSYYAGGSLCVDKIIEGDVITINLDGWVHAFVNDGGKYEPLQASFDNRKRIFAVYLKHKGPTEHYTEEMFKFNA